MKRTLVLLLAAVLLLGAVCSLSACGVRKTSEVTPEPASASEPEAGEDQQAVIEPQEPNPEAGMTDSETGTDSEQPESETEAVAPAPDASALPPKPDIDIYSWEYQLANSYNSIGEYAPPYSGFEGQGINQNIAQAATDFIQAARNAGFYVWCSTAYRNYEYLDSHYLSFRFNVAENAVDAADRMLGPGLSEHQTGLAIDFTDRSDLSAAYDMFEDAYMKDTEVYQWLVEHCAEFGFILRYPEGKEAYYGVACGHPAHFRYVGQTAAEYIMENNLCLEEFLMLYDESLVFLPKP